MQTKALSSSISGSGTNTAPLLLGAVHLRGLYLAAMLQSPAGIGSATSGSLEVYMGSRITGAAASELPIVNVLGVLFLAVPAASMSMPWNQFFPLDLELDSQRLLNVYSACNAANTSMTTYAVFYFDPL